MLPVLQSQTIKSLTRPAEVAIINLEAVIFTHRKLMPSAFERLPVSHKMMLWSGRW